MPTLYHHIYGFSMFNTLTKALHVIAIILQVISSFFVFNKPLEIPSYIPHFSQCYCLVVLYILMIHLTGDTSSASAPKEEILQPLVTHIVFQKSLLYSVKIPTYTLI